MAVTRLRSFMMTITGRWKQQVLLTFVPIYKTKGVVSQKTVISGQNQIRKLVMQGVHQISLVL
jgi:hypothetical protein